tara:strand:- start:209 stop:652 length:444 start_codon:yes stop_codon:yes gene_type:complete
MARVGYFIKNVRENDNTHAVNTSAVLDEDAVGTPDFGGDSYDMFYQWSSSLPASAGSGAAQGALAYVALISAYPNIGKAIADQPTTGFDAAHVIGELSQVYDSTTVSNATSGDDFRLRVGKRIYVFGYAYSSSAAINPDTATINWKD